MLSGQKYNQEEVVSLHSLNTRIPAHLLGELPISQGGLNHLGSRWPCIWITSDIFSSSFVIDNNNRLFSQGCWKK